MNSEEDKGLKNLKKKERKHTQKQASLPSNKNCQDDDGRLAEVNKKKKNKKVETVAVEGVTLKDFSTKEDKKSISKSLIDEDYENDKVNKKKKKNKKVETVTVEGVTLEDFSSNEKKNKKSISKSLFHEDYENDKVNKKKKKNKKVDTVAVEGVTLEDFSSNEKKNKKSISKSLFHEDYENDKVNKKKRKNQFADNENQDKAVLVEEAGMKWRTKEKNNTVQLKADNVNVEKEEVDVEKARNEVQKKAKKSKNNISAVNNEKTGEQVKEKTKKKTENVAKIEMGIIKKKHKVAENGGNLQILENKFDEGGEVRVKMKKKDKTKDVRELETPKVKCSDTVINDEINERKTLGEVGEVEETELNKKRRKRVKREEDEALSNKVNKGGEEDEQCSLVPTNAKLKKGFTQMQKVYNSITEDVKKRRRIKVEEPQEPPQIDVAFLSEKSGNTDEVISNLERRQASQMEIDKATQPEKPTKPLAFGQWSTAQFKSSEQQQKFLRLMGGLKKGFQSAAVSSGGANMAMGKQAQQQLQQGLLGEFERAHSRQMDFSNRGAGLGFSAPSNKKFSIDVNACRSVRFDD